MRTTRLQIHLIQNHQPLPYLDQPQITSIDQDNLDLRDLLTQTSIMSFFTIKMALALKRLFDHVLHY